MDGERSKPDGVSVVKMRDIKQNLEAYKPAQLERGRNKIVELLWIILEALLITSWIPGSWHRLVILRIFGAKIGKGVVFKSGIHVKFPWKLQIGNHSWVGERVWIDNLEHVSIGANVCLSQGVYLCTGSHDWHSETFDLITKSIDIQDGAWIAANASVGPGVVIAEGAVLTLGSVANKSLEAGGIYTGNPAVRLRQR